MVVVQTPCLHTYQVLPGAGHTWCVTAWVSTAGPQCIPLVTVSAVADSSTMCCCHHRLILPRFTKDYGSYYQSAGDIGAVSAACTEGLAVALQDMLRRNADVVGPYAETLEGFYK